MKPLLALTRHTLRLTLREKAAVFFTFVFPLLFFFLFAQMFRASGSGMLQVIALNTVIGVLSNGLFGAGMRAVVERETNILRRFKVAPITPLPMLLASMVTGLLLYIPSLLVTLALAHFLYAMPMPRSLGSLLAFTCLGALAFRSIGLIVASVVNSAQEAAIITQLLFFPMMMLGGAFFPSSFLPDWLQTVSQFVPTAHFSTGIQGILLRNESLAQNALPVVAMLLTAGIGTLLATKLFRWEKEQAVSRGALVWLLAVLAPFLLLGSWQAYSKDNLAKSKELEREFRRTRTRLVRNARLFLGDGRVIETGSVLLRDGRIAEVYDGPGPDPASLNADPVEAAGKTVLPGLIDVHVHLGVPGGVYEKPEEYTKKGQTERALAAYLYSGVTAVRSLGDSTESVLAARRRVNSGEQLGAELFVAGPLFTAKGGHGTEYFDQAPAPLRDTLLAQFVRLPGTANEARQQVSALKQDGVNAIKAILESGTAGMLFNRLDIAVLQAIAEEARRQNLPLAVHTGDSRDVADAVAVGPASVEHGSMRDRIPDALLAAMARRSVAYDPTLSVAEAFTLLKESRATPLDRTLVQQVAPAGLLATTRKVIASPESAGWLSRLREYPTLLPLAQENLRRAHQAGVPLVTGSDAGNLLVVHGPTVHRELQLFVEAGIPPAVALQAATANAARLLGAGDRFGRIAKGLEATLLLVDGNPLLDISATERISTVIFKGEVVSRGDLLK